MANSSLRSKIQETTATAPVTETGTAPVRRSNRPAANGYVNLFVLDAQGKRHRIDIVIPLTDNRNLEHSMLNRLRKAEEAGETVEFKFEGEVVLAKPKAEIQF